MNTRTNIAAAIMAAELSEPSEISNLKAGKSVPELGYDRSDVSDSPDIVDLHSMVGSRM